MVDHVISFLCKHLYKNQFFAGLLGANGSDHLQVVLTPTVRKLLGRFRKNLSLGVSKSSYPPEIRTFATTLQFYSTAAYQYVRRTLLKALPHVSTIRKWFSRMDRGPGFSAFALSLLEQRVEEERKKGKQVLVALMLDDMSIRKQIEYDQKTSQLIGYVDIGSG